MELTEFTGFDWDSGNETKNKDKHGVSKFEAEQVFFNRPILLQEDSQHSQTEARYYALGITDEQRMLMVVFTKRGSKIRVISARDMSRKEKNSYEEHAEI